MGSVKIENISRHFGDVKAVDGISIDAADGEFIALLGPSGCGKTTTLRMIAGLESTDTGNIYIDGRDVTTLPPRDRDVAMVFQDYALYPHMTVFDNIGYPLKVRGISRKNMEKSVTDVANSLQIGNLLDRRPAQLSGGQQQRVSVGRAVVHQAKVFLFDEPLSNLDAKLRLEARAFLKHLQREVGITAVYVTHDQAEAMALANRIVVMQGGKVMQDGPPLEIYHRPANTFVASFIGSPPMNLLSCWIDSANGTLNIENKETIKLENLGRSLPDNIETDKELSLGIRPENIQLLTEPHPDAIEVVPYVTQPLGGETLVIMELGDKLVTVRLFDEDNPSLGETAWIRLNMERAFFYDPEGQLIL